jgi:hypothetical protein
VKKASAPSSALKPSLVACGKPFWAMQHAMILHTMHARDALERVPEQAENVTGLLLGLPGQCGALVGTFVRCVWSVARVGRALFPHCKRRWETAECMVDLYAAAASLAALGLRHQRLEDDARRALASPRQQGRVGEAAKWVGEAALDAFDPAVVWAACGGRSVEQVTDESVGLWAVSGRSLYESTDHFDAFVRMLPFVARAEAEQLYLPRESARNQTWSADDMWRLLVRDRQSLRPETPEGPRAPSRNGPCTCGSGKKYKRCCGADARPRLDGGDPQTPATGAGAAT